MAESAEKLQGMFKLGDCTVHPARNLLEIAGEEKHIEPKAMQVLVVLASRGNEVVSRQELLEKVWPNTFSGDAALTRCISMLRSALGEDKSSPRFIETVSKSGYRLLVPVTQPGETPEEEPPGTIRRHSTFSLSVTLLAILAVALLVSWFMADKEPLPAVDQSIAVLPFANMSGDPANDYLSDGISEEILNLLAQVPDLSVISRSSSFAYRDKEKPLSTIARSLGVNNILEGSVRKSGNRIRIAVQLIEADSEVLLWSDSYDRELTDLFAIQDEISHAVVDTLKMTLDIDSEVTPSVAPEAHEALLRGKYLAAQRSRVSLEAAVDEFHTALSFEPDYAVAHAELALTYMLLRNSQYGSYTESEGFQLAQPHADRAKELAPHLAEANAAAGLLAWRRGDPLLAEKHYKKAIESNPNYAIVYHWLSMLSYRTLGKHEEAFAATKISRRLDPLSIPSLSIYMQMLSRRGMQEQAEIELEKMRALSESTYMRMWGQVMSLQGNWSEAALGNLNALVYEPGSIRARRQLGRELILLGLPDESARMDTGIDPMLHTYLGNFEQAIAESRSKLQSDPTPYSNVKQLALALMFSGSYEEGAPYLEKLWELGNHRVAVGTTGIFTRRDAFMLFVARTETGDEKGAQEVLFAVLEAVQLSRQAGLYVTSRYGSVDYAEGLARFFLGEQEQGMLLMEKAVNDGFFIRLLEPYTRYLSENLRFQELLARQQLTQDREQSKFLNVVCNDTRFHEVWQPSPDRCR